MNFKCPSCGKSFDGPDGDGPDERRCTACLPRVKSTYLWQNGMIMTFDAAGQQIPELQGRKEAVYDRLKAATDAETQWHGFGGEPCLWPSGGLRRDRAC